MGPRTSVDNNVYISSIDLLVTNVPKHIQNVTCIDCELSDCHKMVCWATKMKAPEKVNEQ